MRVFPEWARALSLDAQIKGIDLPLHAPDDMYRDVALYIKNDPLSLGALVTTHKLDMFRACRDIFDYADPYAERLGEVSSLSKRGSVFRAHAKDPVSSGRSLAEFVPDGFWAEHGGEVLVLGAGGSALAMSLYLSQADSGRGAQPRYSDVIDANRTISDYTGIAASPQNNIGSSLSRVSGHGDAPRRITIANRSAPRLETAKIALAGLNTGTEFRFVHGPSPVDNDRLISNLPPYSLIVNATGLGKDAPGSPTTDAVDYPESSLVWEINYRGDLIFMRQARAQAARKHLRVEDGWRYFIHGWTQVIEEVFNIEIDNARLGELSEIAARV